MAASTRIGKRRRSRRPVRRLLILTHRWVSLVAGALLVAIATTGSVLVYEPEIMRALNSAAYTVADPEAPDQISIGEAVEKVQREHPEAEANSVVREAGVYRVDGPTTSYTVDPASGEIIDQLRDRPLWLGFSKNLHHCFLTCEELPANVSALETDVPGTAWLTGRDKPVDLAGLILGGVAVMLLFLVASGLWLWFPRPRRWRSGFTVRMNRGRFARDTDLHKVIGVAALVPLLVWGITGTGFEFAAVSKVWYALTPGQESEVPDPESVGSGPDIRVDQAAAAAREVIPGGEVTRINLPKGDEPDAAYRVMLRDGYDAMARSRYPGDLRVEVPRSGGVGVIVRGNPEQDLTQRVWEQWKYPAHAGSFVNPWIRAVWFIGGLTPLALMVTGVSTWLYRHNSAKRRAAAKKAAAAR
ncbi:PepSY-associated TM helix domain-containing protein [Gephyromycinifex aptenodytis]|uniref:PepSY-associated TM helix domain-containing protein n=1 Tax=Gephyromycinifex aptenodytis TaxID=2716227 RepID=UPI001446582D|nr:PepSY-associated TM helix domain-containing protein [Gephyromycinifex aptenodytis]